MWYSEPDVQAQGSGPEGDAVQGWRKEKLHGDLAALRITDNEDLAAEDLAA